MNSLLSLHHGALRIPSTASSAAGLARPYSSFRPSSLSLVSKASTYRTPWQHTFTSPLICALNNPSPPWPNYDKDHGKNIVKVVGCASVVLACVLGVINCNYNFRTTAIAAQKTKLRATDSSTQGGDILVLSKPKDVLDSLLKLNRPLATHKGKWYSSTQKLEITERPTPEDREKLKTAVAGLIQSGKCDEAERQLRALYRKTKGGEPARDVEMELVLVLIFQEKYKEALESKCLGDDSGILTDGRVHFYKAIIHTMLGQNDDAEKCWNNFVSSFSVTRDMLKAQSEVPNPKKQRIGR